MVKKIAKVSDKLAKTDANFYVNMYDNGYLIEISGKDSNDDYKTAKIIVGSAEDLLEIIREVLEMPRAE